MGKKIHKRFHEDEAEPSPVKKARLDDKKVPIDATPANKTQLASHSRSNHHPSLKQRASTLLPSRRALPIWPRQADIAESLRSHDILLLVGETGSGKSTQIPQFLLSEPWCQPRSVHIPSQDPSSDSQSTSKVKVGGCIAITQPRRVAAISLARRVAEEFGSTLGNASPASKVGYSVRFDNSTSPCTRIKFLTEGMLLQELLRDPWLKQYSAVVVDEVHERGVNVDLVLGFLRTMAKGKNEGRGGIGMKVVVMSATAEMESLRSFFGETAIGENTTRKVKRGEKQEAEPEWSGFSDEESDTSREQIEKKPSLALAQKTPSAESSGSTPDSASKVSVCHIEGRQYPVKMIYSPVPVPDFVDASLRTVFQINHAEPLPGDILVFLTGQSTVESLTSLINEYSPSLSRSVPKLLPLPLFAALPQAAQQRVFQPAPPRTRKVIISTNIAETSVTVPGVRFVIDSGLTKTKQFRSRLGLDSLLVKPISKSSATQRAGRAGREAAGTCYRLYTQPDFENLEQAAQPEILRADLAHAILTLKARGVADIGSFPFLSPPGREGLLAALQQLYFLSALDDSGGITRIGHAIARLPLSAPLGRALLAAAEPQFDCLDDMIDVVAALSVEKVFLELTDEEKREKAEVARAGLLRREGDHATLLATVKAYVEENSDRKSWAEKHWVSHRAMQSVMDVRKQLLALKGEILAAVDSGEVQGAKKQAINGIASGTDEGTARLLKALLRGFPMNTALLCPDGSYRTSGKKQIVAIHPTSVLFQRKVPAIVYTEYVYTTKSYARGVSAIETHWILEVADNWGRGNSI